MLNKSAKSYFKDLLTPVFQLNVDPVSSDSNSIITEYSIEDVLKLNDKELEDRIATITSNKESI